MTKDTKTPPRWMERLLEHLLPAHTREHIVGDLREEYIEAQMPQRGRFRTNVWYARHVVSFLPAALRESRIMGKLLLFTSGFTMVSLLWLALEEGALRHPGYGNRIALDLCLALLCLVTACFRMLPVRQIRSETCLRGMWLLVMFLGAATFYQNAHSAHFEGYIFIVSLLLVAQGLLMVLTLGRGGASIPGQPVK
jgi:hypothetical protein